jgi:hypothetical protein
LTGQPRLGGVHFGVEQDMLTCIHWLNISVLSGELMTSSIFSAPLKNLKRKNNNILKKDLSLSTYNKL